LALRRSSADPLARALADVVGAANVLVDPDLKAGYEVDWTGRWRAPSRLVVRPGDTAEVAAVVRECAAAGVAIVPQGGNTGFVGGGVPRGGEAVVSLSRLNDVEPVDEAAGHVGAGAGATLADVQATARRAGLFLALDLGARDNATIGGVLATNAGGNRAFRYGMARAHVTGIEAVTADGSVISRLAGLPKDNTGYDLAQLIVGSEGTLAVITRARLALTSRGSSIATALVGLESTAAAVDLFAALRRALPELDAAELFYADGLALTRAHGGLPLPLAREFPVYLLLECAAPDDAAERLAVALGGAGDVADSAVADDSSTRERLWRYREGHTEAVGARWTPLKLDVALPLARLAGFVDELERLAESRWPAGRLFVYGHVGDGNLHIQLVDLDPDQERDATRTVLELVATHGGSIGAEHGIGVAKRDWLHLTRAPADIAAMRAVKRALDPGGLLNPGVLLPGD
jgi:FAD/FMN-containing dehydrogenase